MCINLTMTPHINVMDHSWVISCTTRLLSSQIGLIMTFMTIMTTLCVCTISSDGKLSEARKNISQFTLCTCYAKSLQLFLTLCESMDCSLPGYSVCGDSAGKNIEVGCHALPSRGVFLTQGLNLCLLWLLRWQAGFFFFFNQQCHLGSPQFTLANINWTLTINKAVNYFHTAVLSKGLHPEYWNADWFPTVLLANPWLSRTYSGTAVCSGLWSPHSCQSSAIMWPSVDKLITARRFLTDSDGCCLAI